jgi:transposase
MIHQHTIQLSRSEHNTLHALTHKGTHSARVLIRARILLLSHEGKGKDAIAKELHIGRSTVQRIRDQFRDDGLDRALYDLPRSGQPRKLSPKAEAHLVALACSNPPKGRDCWTLELLRQRMIKEKRVVEISTVALWHRLKDHDLKPWQEKNVVRPEPDTALHRADGASSRPLRKAV